MTGERLLHHFYGLLLLGLAVTVTCFLYATFVIIPAFLRGDWPAFFLACSIPVALTLLVLWRLCVGATP